MSMWKANEIRLLSVIQTSGQDVGLMMREERDKNNDGDWNSQKVEQNGSHGSPFLDELHSIALPAAKRRRKARAERSDQKREKEPQ